MSSREAIRRNFYIGVGVFVIAALGLAASGYRYYLDQEAAIEAQARDQLGAVAQLKVQQIVEWRRERLADARMVAATGVPPSVQALLAGRDDPQTREQGRAWVAELCDATGYANAILVDRTGKVRVGVGLNPNAGEHYAGLAREALERGLVSFSDIHRDTGLRGPHLGLNVPLRLRPDQPPQGALLLGIDPRTFLYPLIQTWPVPSRTAETLLVRREGDEVVYLNDVRHRQHTALNLRVPLTARAVPAVRGVLGFEGVTQGLDYRGVPVLAAVRRVPDTSWVLISKVDLAELYAPVRQQAFWLLLIGCAVTLAIGAGAALLIRDFRLRFYQQRYEAEVERRALLGHYDYLSRFANDIILLTDRHGRIVEANDRAVSAYGYSRDELIGMSIGQLPEVAPAEEFHRHWQALEQQDGRVFETRHRRKDGTTFPVEVSARRIVVEGTEFRQAIIRDTTERTRLQGQLQQAQKMESIGLLAGGVAHDFNNLLTSILGNASLALAEPPDQHGERLETIVTAAERAADLTRQLLAYAGKGEFMVEDVSLSVLVCETMELLRVTIPKTVQVRVDLRQELPAIRTDRSQVQQVLMNLVINAAEAIGQRAGLIRIRTAVERFDSPRRTPFATEIAPGDFVLLEVADNGCGMDEQVRTRIFDPFYTTKFTGRGLGLAAVSGVVRSCGGTIEVESAPGVGTTFRVFFPVAARAAAQPPPSSAPRPGPGGTILVVDEEEPVRDLLRRALKKSGYTVLAAANGREALEAARTSPRLDLAVLDVVTLAGDQLLDALRSLHPGLRVLLTSGWSQEETRRILAAHPGIDVVPKPYKIDQVLSKIESVLQ